MDGVARRTESQQITRRLCKVSRFILKPENLIKNNNRSCEGGTAQPPEPETLFTTPTSTRARTEDDKINYVFLELFSWVYFLWPGYTHKCSGGRHLHASWRLGHYRSNCDIVVSGNGCLGNLIGVTSTPVLSRKENVFYSTVTFTIITIITVNINNTDISHLIPSSVIGTCHGTD